MFAREIQMNQCVSKNLLSPFSVTAYRFFTQQMYKGSIIDSSLSFLSELMFLVPNFFTAHGFYMRNLQLEGL